MFGSGKGSRRDVEPPGLEVAIARSENSGSQPAPRALASPCVSGDPNVVQRGRPAQAEGVGGNIAAFPGSETSDDGGENGEQVEVGTADMFGLAPKHVSTFKKGAKQCGVKLLQSLPALPDCIWDRWLKRSIEGGDQERGLPTRPLVEYIEHGSGVAPKKALTYHAEALPPKADGAVRCVVVSDTHERHRKVVIPEGDVLFHCGDILMSSSLTHRSRSLKQLADFNEWLAESPCPERVVVGGNHDAALQALTKEQRAQVLSAAIPLQHELVQLPRSGLKVYGNGYSRGHSHNCAWQQEDVAEIAERCVGADVMVTHWLCEEIYSAVSNNASPLMWASGHAHGSHGAFRNKGTIFVNGAICDKAYRPTQAPFVVDLHLPP